MLPRFRSFYGKFIVLALVILCFVLYIKVLQVEHSIDTISASTGEETKYEAQQQQQQQQQIQEPLTGKLKSIAWNVHENEILKDTSDSQKSWLDVTTVSPYEASIRLDLDKQQVDLGNEGKAVHMTGASKRRGDEIYKKIALNEELSELLPYNRTLRDVRHPSCQKMSYDIQTMPTTSVIIIFYNEPYSVLLRTIHSTLNTCNTKLLKEIILVDDGSTNLELHGKLDYYVSSRIPSGKVKVLRLKNRLGLIRARLAGARNATGDVLIFLDAHCEGTIGWCEPLLQRIKESRTSVLVPIIDVIDSKDFSYSTNGYKTFQVGGFEWNGHFNWINVSPREKQRQLRECHMPRGICPTYSPTMAGGLFAIDRHYFWESGSYDEQMDGWGGENLEMSFRIWQCGGTIETIPCSRVGHVFRDFHPYKFPNDRDTHGLNTARMAMVWMDDYVNIFFMYRPDLKLNPDVGDVTHRIMLRKKLRCKSFDWYLSNIYPEKFIPTKNVIGYGRIKSANGQLCLDDLLQNEEKPFNMGLFSCGSKQSKSQFFSLTNNQVLRNEASCATVQHSDSPSPHLVVMVQCIDRDEFNDKWKYTASGQLIHIESELCLDHVGLKSMDDVLVRQCDSNSETQRWIFEHDEL